MFVPVFGSGVFLKAMWEGGPGKCQNPNANLGALQRSQTQFSQPPVAPVPGYPVLSYGLHEHCMVNVTFISSDEVMRGEPYLSFMNTWLGLSPERFYLTIPRPRSF